MARPGWAIPLDMSVTMSKLVLIVDDDPDALDAMRLLLSTSGYDVRTASDGTEALTLLSAGLSPRLVITDIMMPELTGWELLQAMRADHALQTVPVVMMTASFISSHPEGVPVLEKPFGLDSLLAIVDKYCSSPPDGDLPGRAGESANGKRRTRAA